MDQNKINVSLCISHGVAKEGYMYLYDAIYTEQK